MSLALSLPIPILSGRLEAMTFCACSSCLSLKVTTALPTVSLISVRKSESVAISGALASVSLVSMALAAKLPSIKAIALNKM